MKFELVCPPPSKPNFSNFDVCGNTNIAINGSSGIRYRWFNSKNKLIDTLNTFRYNIIKTDTFFVSTLDKNCESLKDTIIITLNALPVVSMAKTICNGDSVKIGDTTINTNFDFQWDNGIKLSQIYVKPTSNTWYKLTKTNRTTGCKNTDSVLIIVNSLPKMYLGANKIICLRDSTLILDSVKSGSFSYLWSNGKNQNSQFVKPTTNTWYKLTKTNTVSGCNAIDSIRIVVNPLPNPR